jgi:translation initiation factor 5
LKLIDKNPSAVYRFNESMSLINIGGDPDDASYRYKMPALVTKIEGRGNGIKTVVVNMSDVSKALHCEPGYPTKFLGIELGAISKYTPATERAVVNGAHQQPDMQKLLMKFIEIFVLCPTCSLPEIKYKVKSTAIKIDCAACGHNGKLKTQHKLVTYILNHPPTKRKGDKDNKMSKEERRKLKNKAREEAKAEGEGGKTGKKSKKEKEQAWFTDTSKEAQDKRKEQEFAEMAQRHEETQSLVDKIIKNASAENKSDSPVTILQIFLASGAREPIEVVSELRRIELSRGLDEPQKIKVLLEALLDLGDLKSVPAQFTKHAPLFSHLLAQGNAQTATCLIGCIENLVGVVEPKLLARTPLVLQALYEADVLEEDVLLAWANSPPESSWLVNKEVATNVRNKAAPFIDWLKEADSEDEE